jgi:polyisoprenoid-binding protein YceI
MSTTLQQLPAGTYGVDKIHSSIGFGVRHMGISTFRTTFGEYDAAYADGTLTGSVQVDSIDIDLPDFKNHVLAEEFFNAAVTPTVTFRSREIRVTEDGVAEVEGDLTIKGITKPVLATGTYVQGDDPMGNERVAFELEALVDRREYGLNWQTPTPSGNDVLAWDVTLQVHLELVKA